MTTRDTSPASILSEMAEISKSAYKIENNVELFSFHKKEEDCSKCAELWIAASKFIDGIEFL